MEVANMLGSVGIFFTGLGILLASFGFLWWCTLYSKTKWSKQKEEK